MDVKNFVKAVIGTLSTEISVHLLGFVTTILLVRNMSPANFGIFSLIMSFSLTLYYLSNMGLSQAIVFSLGKRNDPVEKIVGLAMILFLGLGFATIAICFLFKNYALHSFLKEVPDTYFRLILVLYFFYLMDSFLLSVTRGLQNFMLFNVRRFLTPVCNILGLFLLLAFWGISLEYVVIVFVGVSGVLTVWFLFKVLSITSFRFEPAWGSVRSFVVYGVKSFLQTLSGHLIYQIDLYIIAYLLGAKEVAFYGIAVGVATLLWYIPNTVGLVLFPALSSIHDEKEIHLFSGQVCRNTLLITAWGGISLGLIGKFLILLFYGTQYSRSVNAMLLILPGVVAMSVYKVLTRNFSSRNRQQISIMAASVSLVVNIVLNFAWIPKYGIDGAALASSVSYVIAAIILVFMIKIESGIPLRKLLIVDKEDIRSYAGLVRRLQKSYLGSRN